MIPYRVISHVPGRVRLSVPVLKRLTVSDMMKLSEMRVPDGVRKVRANPAAGSIVIEYDCSAVNINEIISGILRDPETMEIARKYL